jgi:signal transduction histidine kinase
MGGRLHFERLLAHLSRRLAALPIGALDEALETALARIVEAFELDRATVWVLLESGDLELTWQAVRERARAAPRLLAATALPWTYSRIVRGHRVILSSLDDLPAEAAVDRQTMQVLGPRATVALPLAAGGRVIGAVGFGMLRAERKWARKVIRRLDLLAQAMGAALFRKRAHEAVSEVARVSTVSELAGFLAHELNQPLTAILSNAQAAARFLARDPDEVRETLSDIVSDVRRAADIIDRMRALARRDAPHGPVDLGGVVSDVVALIRGEAARRGVVIELRCDEVVEVDGDRVQLQQVLLNLIRNGFDALERCGVGERTVTVRVEPEERSVRVSVSDGGRGVSPQMVERMFLPFYTTKPHGMGMGLSICRSIVEAHGGRVGVRSNRTRGATVWFSLPTVAEGEGASTRAEAASPPDPT